MSDRIPVDKYDLAAVERARAADLLSQEEIARLLEWMKDMNWPVARPVADVLATVGLPIVEPLKAALAEDDEIWTEWLETVLLPRLSAEVRLSLVNAPLPTVGPKASSGGTTGGDGEQTAPLQRLGAWADLPFFRDDWPGIEAAIAAETRTVLPPAPQRFAALERTQPDDTHVVILGQDPYPTRGHANGLAFSVTPETPLPRSLANIYKELEADIGAKPVNGDLGFWADQGVLLLNTALTVPEGEAGGHAKLGWATLTRQVLERLEDTPRAVLLWGKHAQKLGQSLSDHQLKIETAHPSPLSASRGFFGSRPFSRINTWLEARGDAPIRWA